MAGGRQWTQEETDFLIDCRRRNIPYQDIADDLGFDLFRVRQKAWNLHQSGVGGLHIAYRAPREMTVRQKALKNEAVSGAEIARREKLRNAQASIAHLKDLMRVYGEDRLGVVKSSDTDLTGVRNAMHYEQIRFSYMGSPASMCGEAKV